MSAELEKDWRILFLRLIKSEMLYQHSVIGTAEGRGEGGEGGGSRNKNPVELSVHT